MQIGFSSSDEAFRQEVRQFFAEEYPQDILAKVQRGQSLGKDDLVRSEQALHEKGWIAVNWPVEHGGTGWTPTQKYIFDDELERAGAPSVVPMGLLYVAPVIYTFGSEEQKKRFLPDIHASRVFWAQGYSEPGAGSDLASLQTRADPEGDDYVVNGVKIWTSLGTYADWIFCLVRTGHEGKPQEGISFLCIDMSTPGVTVRPIGLIDGSDYLAEVHFEDVHVPKANRIGEENKGWTYAKYLLTHERTSYAHIAGKKRDVERLKELAMSQRSGNASLWEDQVFRAKVAEVETELTALEFTALRALSSLAAGEAPGKESSALKILATENAQAITELFLEAVGAYAVPFARDRGPQNWSERLGVPSFAAPATSAYFFTRAQTIYGGSTEIQKNVIAKQALGLG